MIPGVLSKRDSLPMLKLQIDPVPAWVSDRRCRIANCFNDLICGGLELPCLERASKMVVSRPALPHIHSLRLPTSA